MPIAPSLITINLEAPHPDPGGASTIIRLTTRDKSIIDIAADELGWPKAMLMRVLLIRGAQKILDELGVELEYT